MKSIAFPDMFASTFTRTTEGSSATLSNIKLLLTTEMGSLYGDPYFGTKLRRFVYEQNNIVLRDLIIDDIYLAITTFIPQVYIRRNDIVITQDDTSIYARINCINKLDNTTSNYEIKLLDNLL